MDEDIKEYKIRCHGPTGKSKIKMVTPVTCRNCSEKMTCPSVQELLAAKRNYAEKFKGTILESSMDMVVGLKIRVAKFILGK